MNITSLINQSSASEAVKDKALNQSDFENLPVHHLAQDVMDRVFLVLCRYAFNDPVSIEAFGGCVGIVFLGIEKRLSVSIVACTGYSSIEILCQTATFRKLEPFLENIERYVNPTEQHFKSAFEWLVNGDE